MGTTTFLEEAYQVLREAKTPMHIDRIIEKVHARGLWQSKAQEKWIQSSLYGTMVKAWQQGDKRFKRIGNGPYFSA